MWTLSIRTGTVSRSIGTPPAVTATPEAYFVGWEYKLCHFSRAQVGLIHLVKMMNSFEPGFLPLFVQHPLTQLFKLDFHCK